MEDYRNGLPTVANIIKQLQKLPQDRGVQCQLVVEGKPGAWNMYFDIDNIPTSDWLVQLKVYHPNMKDLPDVIE